MKMHTAFKSKLGCNSSKEVFDYLVHTLKSTITRWDYFVNWQKVDKNIRKLEIHLNLLNYLIGKEEIESEAEKLIQQHPEIISSIPVLVASREMHFQLLKDYQNGEFSYEDYKFDSSMPAKKAVEFMSKSGILVQLKNRRVKSLVDYVFGVEVGLDSNGRKNRGGKAMEDIIEFFVNRVCSKNGYEYMTQATSSKISKAWGINLKVDKSKRKLDFAIKTNENKIILIEANFYSGGGSKLKSTAGEYQTLFNFLKEDGHTFIWITDGAGWHATKKPLEETFNKIDYILNLQMIEDGVLEDLMAISSIPKT